nr:hypothetical protein CFP56_64930 [Quercus suber]
MLTPLSIVPTCLTNPGEKSLLILLCSSRIWVRSASCSPIFYIPSASLPCKRVETLLRSESVEVVDTVLLWKGCEEERETTRGHFYGQKFISFLDMVVCDPAYK